MSKRLYRSLGLAAALLFVSVMTAAAQDFGSFLNQVAHDVENAIENQANHPGPPAPPPPSIPLAGITPDMAYRQLVAGNARYTRNATRAAELLPMPADDPNGPPIATVIFNPESRTTPDYVFDTSPAHLYQVPTRASVFTSDQLDDLEFGIVNLRTPLVVVMTHNPSREIQHLLDVWPGIQDEARAQIERAGSFYSGPGAPPPNDDELLYSLAGSAVARAYSAYPDAPPEDMSRYIAESIAWGSIETMFMQSQALRQLVADGLVDVVAAVLDDATGEVEWLGRHPLTTEFLKVAPHNVVESYTNTSFTEATLPPPLNDQQLGVYFRNGGMFRYYTDMVNQYYYRPAPTAPSWNLFHPNVWQFRPWYGFWIPSFLPLPAYHPWDYGVFYDNPRWTPGFHFFVGYNWGEFRHIPGDFHPIDPRWDLAIFLDPTHHPGWHPGDPRDVIWHYGPSPHFHPGPNHYFGPFGPFPPGDPHWGEWHPGDHHPGHDHPGGDPHHNDPWPDNPPEWLHKIGGGAGVNVDRNPVIGGGGSVHIDENPVIGGGAGVNVNRNPVIGGGAGVHVDENPVIGGGAGVHVDRNPVIGGGAGVNVERNNEIGGGAGVHVERNHEIGGGAGVNVERNNEIGGGAGVNVERNNEIGGGAGVNQKPEEHHGWNFLHRPQPSNIHVSNHRIPQEERPAEEQKLPIFGGFHPKGGNPIIHTGHLGTPAPSEPEPAAEDSEQRDDSRPIHREPAIGGGLRHPIHHR